MHGATDRPLMSDAARRERHARPHRGVLGAALAASVLLHAALFLLFRFSVDITPDVQPRSAQPLVEIVPAMQVYELVEVPGEAAPIAVQIERRTLERPAERGTPPGEPRSRMAGEQTPGAVPDPMSVRDRLRYRMAAPEVWQPPSPERVAELTPQEIVEQRIARQLGEFNDSVAAEAAARERALDWTVKDGDGGRWGVSPGKIHLGGVTLPLPLALTAAPGRREEFAGRVRTWSELQEQASRVEARDEFKDRVRAINERMDRERANRNSTAADTLPPPSTGGGAGSSSPPGNR
jgi:hypothetical protein